MNYGQLSADGTSLVKYPIYDFELTSTLKAKYPSASIPSVITPEFALSEGYVEVTLVAPPTTLLYQRIVEGTPTLINGVWTQTWVVQDYTLAEAQSIHSTTISNSCASAIYAGFTSTALGSTYTYPAKDLDQQNLSASVLASLMPGIASTWSTPFWCMDSTGNWAFVNHTASQIQQVGTDGKAAILTAMSKNQTLQTQIATATTVDQVRAITW